MADLVVHYTPEAKSVAKSLVLALGSARAAERHLVDLWGEDDGSPPIPDRRTLDRWKLDPAIVPDEAFLERFRSEVRNATLGAAHRLGEKLETLLSNTIDRAETGTQKTLDVLNAAKSWGIVADKMNGRFGNPETTPGGMTFNGNVTFVAFGPKPPKVIDAEFSEPGDS